MDRVVNCVSVAVGVGAAAACFVMGRKSVNCLDVPSFGVQSAPVRPIALDVPTPQPVVASATTRTVLRCPQPPVNGTPVASIEVEVVTRAVASAPSPAAPTLIQVAAGDKNRYHLVLGGFTDPGNPGDWGIQIGGNARIGNWPLFVGPVVLFKPQSFVPAGVGLNFTWEF